jgi:hypothetical protein
VASIAFRCPGHAHARLRFALCGSGHVAVESRRHRRERFARYFLVLHASLFGWILPGLDPRLRAYHFARKVTVRLPPERELYFYDVRYAAVSFYVRQPVRRIGIEKIREESANRGSL